MDRETKGIEKISKGLLSFQKYPKAPRRFKRPVGTNDLRFNYSTQVDTLFISGMEFLHMVYMEKNFVQRHFLRTNHHVRYGKTIPEPMEPSI